MPAHASSKSKVALRLLISTPSAFGEPPKYSPTIAPIMESTVAIFRPVKSSGSAVGIRTRRKMSVAPAAYERISSIEAGRTDVSPRSVFTKTGKKHSTAAIAIFEVLPNGPNNGVGVGQRAGAG